FAASLEQHARESLGGAEVVAVAVSVAHVAPAAQVLRARVEATGPAGGRERPEDERGCRRRFVVDAERVVRARVPGIAEVGEIGRLAALPGPGDDAALRDEADAPGPRAPAAGERRRAAAREPEPLDRGARAVDVAAVRAHRAPEAVELDEAEVAGAGV